jgi:hypothetical protein
MPIEFRVVNTHAPFSRVLLLYQDWIGQPVGMEDFSYEPGYHQFCNFFLDCCFLVR